MWGWLKRVAVILALILGGVWAFAPKEPVYPDIAFDPGMLPEDLVTHFQISEAAVPDLKDGAAKTIVWAGEAGTKTPFSVVYLHGFSASLEEIRPVPDRVAETLGANLFYTRFTGHGRDGAAMTEPRAGDWINDTAEALEVGRRLGERVIVISTSTGATLASLAETAKTQDTEIAAHVMISPNFALNSRLAFLLDLPAVRYWAPLVAGKEAGFEPVNDQQEYFWTTRYPTQAVMPMAALVRENRGRDVALARAPALFLISDEDKVVRPDVTRRISENWGGGGTVVQLRLGEGDDPYKHVLAGDIVSPGQTERTVQAITDWLADVLGQ